LARLRSTNWAMSAETPAVNPLCVRADI